jgi:hypothetical protein
MDDCDGWADRVLANCAVESVPQPIIPGVISSLRAKKAEYVRVGEYRQAMCCERKVTELKFASTEEAYDDLQHSRVAEAQQRVDVARRELAGRCEAWDRVLAQFEQDRQRSLAEFDEAAAKELTAFNEKHNVLEPPPKFRKFSYDYLNLVMREKYMVASKRFLEANALRAEASELEQKEKAVQKTNWDSYVEIHRQILLNHQREQRRILEAKWEKDWDALAPSGEAEIDKYATAVSNLEARLVDVQQGHNVAISGLTARGKLPPLQNSGPPACVDGLRSRLAYVRAKNYTVARKSLIYKRGKV